MADPKVTTVTPAEELPAPAQVVVSSADLTQPVAVVNVVDNGWLGKINITQVVQIVATAAVLLTGGKLNITPEQQVQLVGAIVLIGNVATMLFKVYFTSTVAKQSLPAQHG